MISITNDQYKWLKDHYINISAFCRDKMQEYIENETKIKESEYENEKGNFSEQTM